MRTYEVLHLCNFKVAISLFSIHYHRTHVHLTMCQLYLFSLKLVPTFHFIFTWNSRFIRSRLFFTSFSFHTSLPKYQSIRMKFAFKTVKLHYQYEIFSNFSSHWQHSFCWNINTGTRKMCQNIEKGSRIQWKNEKNVFDIHKFVTNGKASFITEWSLSEIICLHQMRCLDTKKKTKYTSSFQKRKLLYIILIKRNGLSWGYDANKRFYLKLSKNKLEHFFSPSIRRNVPFHSLFFFLVRCQYLWFRWASSQTP